MTHNSKEQDRESELADHGVRKYDYDIGRFASTDVLFEKYYGWFPYQYSANNPINMLDWNGLDAVAVVVTFVQAFSDKSEDDVDRSTPTGPFIEFEASYGIGSLSGTYSFDSEKKNSKFFSQIYKLHDFYTKTIGLGVSAIPVSGSVGIDKTFLEEK